MNRLKFAAGLLGMVLCAAGSAWADDCTGTLRTGAVSAALRPVTTGEQLQAALKDLDAIVAQCPADPWINALGAEMDLRVYNALLAANNNQVNQQALDFLQRGLARSDVYMNTAADMRGEVFAIQTEHGKGNLTHSFASTNRKSILQIFMAMARLGQVHPYFKAETPKTCTGWLMSDTQTVGYAMETEADLIFRPFIDAAAEACRGEGNDRLPLAVASQAYVRLVERGAITFRSDISKALLKARDYRDAYLSRGGFDFHYSKFDADRLDRELRKHEVDPMAGRLAREQWFTEEHFGSEKMQFSLAWALSEEWASISEKLAKGEIELAAGGTQYTRFAYDVLKDGREAGKEAETKAALRTALSDVQQSRVRAIAMADYELPPQWLHDMLMKTAAAPPEGN